MVIPIIIHGPELANSGYRKVKNTTIKYHTTKIIPAISSDFHDITKPIMNRKNVINRV